MFKWPWSSCNFIKHNVFAWDEPVESICIYLKPNNPFKLRSLAVCGDNYVLEETHIFYKILDKQTRSTLICVSKEYVDTATVISDLN